MAFTGRHGTTAETWQKMREAISIMRASCSVYLG